MKKLSIVLPVYNESDSIEKVFRLVKSATKKIKGYSTHIIISDGPSTDGTSEVASKIAKNNKEVSYIVSKVGLGIALYRGHKYALDNIKPDVLLQMDADGQIDEKIIIGLVKTIEEGYDLAIGSRFVKGGKNLLPVSRRIFSWGSSMFCRILMGPWKVREFTNSARAFTPDLFKKIRWGKLPWKEKTFILMPAFLHEAITVGAKYKEVPIVFKSRAAGYSKNKIVMYTLDIIGYTIDMRLKKMGIRFPLFKKLSKLRRRFL